MVRWNILFTLDVKKDEEKEFLPQKYIGKFRWEILSLEGK